MRANTRTKPPKHMRAKKSLATVFNDVRFVEACNKRGADPLDTLARAIASEEIDLEQRANLSLKALKFLMPEKKAIEHTGENGEPIRFIIES